MLLCLTSSTLNMLKNRFLSRPVGLEPTTAGFGNQNSTN